MRNFDYIKSLGLNDLYRFCAAAEELQVQSPDLSAINARRALEYIVRALYYMKNIEVPERATLFELVDGEPFTEFVADERVMMAVHYIRKVGNKGAHEGTVTRKESFFCLLNIYNVVGAILMKLRVVQELPPFDGTLVPQKAEAPTLVEPAAAITAADDLVKKANHDAAQSRAAVCELPSALSEAETRRLYIDLMLQEAGWQVLTRKGAVQPLRACIEVKLQGMPNAHDVGFADYVLFGADGLPLAVVEAKRTSISPIEGKHQAELYADCLEQQYGRRPVVYYSNGFETRIIDGMGYPARRLYGFHTADDLERMIQQRGRRDITDLHVQDAITDRHYQKMAIRAVAEHYNGKHRRALLVMATGTGKTRVAISLTDVLMRNGWVKNVLFLADRTSLVTQAHKNFVKLLPHATTCVLSDGGSTRDMQARIVFSTYQTMINYIDTDDKPFSVGRFDLIIIDEAHRSIFGKYAAIFHYFDALLVGLTATPRDQVDRSTYDIFEMEPGVPNYAYELQEAVRDGYLVDYQGLKRGSLILDDGIRYSNLTADERRQMEAVWEYEQARQALDYRHTTTRQTPAGVIGDDEAQGLAAEGGARDIRSNEIFTYIFNRNTVDAVLQDLMEHGIAVQSGERIGKTIIFAYNHRHAELIVERFQALYPHLGPDFCVLIDNYVTYAQSLIDKFEVRDGEPQIAVSVDMLDTGIDVPDIVNLVFFKRVHSRIKFMQMIGRGTRLSPELFGPGQDKKGFYIFDWCRNFEYFEQEGHDTEPLPAPSLTERLFGLRTDIAFHLQHQQWQEDAYGKGLHDDLKALLHAQVEELSDSHISVREHWEAVSRFKNADAWQYISETDTVTLKNDIAPLLPKNKMDENAKKFDLLTFTIELSLLDGETAATRSAERVQLIAQRLQEKASLPQVQARMATIKEVLSPVAWENVSLPWLEKVRTELRDLMRFLVGDSGKWFLVDIADIISDKGMAGSISLQVTYKQKVLDYLAANRHHPVLDKVYNLEQLDAHDIAELERILWQELGSREDYEAYTHGMACGANVAIFIRSLLGVDRKEAVRRFSQFLSGSELNADQQEFIATIIAYVCENGDITKEIVVNEPPFDDKLVVFNGAMTNLANYVNHLHTVIIPPETA